MRSMIASSEDVRNILGLQTFFKPDYKMVDWILEYASDRLIIDAGCGARFPFTMQLVESGATQVLAIDPYIDYAWMTLQRNLHMDKFTYASIHILEMRIEQMSDLYNSTSTQSPLIIFARPCHSNFVYETLKIKGDHVEVLYITKEENLTLHNDLGEFKSKAIKVPHKGKSLDNEVVYSIK